MWAIGKITLLKKLIMIDVRLHSILLKLHIEKVKKKYHANNVINTSLITDYTTFVNLSQ